jgi:hypothetical protein
MEQCWDAQPGHKNEADLSQHLLWFQGCLSVEQKYEAVLGCTAWA